MIQFFRNIIYSKLGGGLTILFILLVAGAFALGDVTGLMDGGKVASGDEIAKVGSQKITAAEFEKALQTALESEKEKNPRLSMKAFLAGGGGEMVLTQLLDRAAIAEFGRDHGIVISDSVIDSEIAQLPATQGPDGKFSQALYQQLLQQRGLTDKLVRQDLASGLIAKQVLVPAAFGAVFPREGTWRYAQLLRERRIGAIALLPSASFAPKTPPSEAEIAAHYNKTRNSYLLPERRVIRYATFDAAVVKTVAPPTEAEIAARYNANKAAYAASETRKLTQLIVPTEAAARAVLAEVGKGVSLEKSASSKGLSTATLTQSKSQLAAQSSAAVADAAFAAPQGSLAGLARSGLGWHVVRVDAIDAKPARTLDQVRGELTQQLAEFKRRQALSDFSARIEEEFENGGSLTDVAKELGLALVQTEPLTADGKVHGQADKTAPAELARVVPAAFAMERENQPQLAEVEAGQKFVVFDVTRITPSAAAPLAEVRTAVTAELMLERGSVAAKAAADKVLAAAKRGTDLAAAMASLGMPLPPVDQVDIPREKLPEMGQQVPPPIVLLFSMAQGTTKLLPAPRNRGWYVVSVKQIIPGNVAPNDPMLASAQKELGGLVGREYADQLRRAIRAEVGVTRNDAAISAVTKQLSGGV